LAQTPIWEFEMYIAEQTPKSELTYNNLREICDQYLDNKCVINVIDLLKNPKIALEKQILATPTTVRKKPAPERILIGTLSNTDQVIIKFDLKGYRLKSRGTMVSFKENLFSPSDKRARMLNCKPFSLDFNFK
jgi:circadian clock protein KaiB